MTDQTPEIITNPRERAYDEHLAPLMAQIIALAKQHGIPMLADFELDPVDGDEDNPLRCTTIIHDAYGIPKARSEAFLGACRALRPRHSGGFALAETITMNPDGTKRVSIRFL